VQLTAENDRVLIEFTRPKNSSMIFGGWPAVGITVGAEISFAMGQKLQPNSAQRN
jgi:hypothetical protein